MKKVITTALILLIFVTLALNSFAYTPTEIQDKIFNENAQELEAVALTIELNNQNPDNRQINTQALDLSRAFRLYYFNDGDIIKAYEENGNFGKNITDKYCWLVPYSDDSGEVEIVRSENSPTEWAVKIISEFNAQMLQNVPTVAPGILGAYEVIIKGCPNFDINSLRLCESNQLKCRLMYFTSNGEEYIIPYFNTVSAYFTTGKVYSMPDFIEAAKRSLKNGDVTPETEDDYSFDEIYLYYIIGGTVIVAGVVVFVIIKAKKSNPNENDETPPTEQSNKD